MNSILLKRIKIGWFDFICIGFGVVAIGINNFLPAIQAWALFLTGLILIIISLYNLLSKQPSRHGVEQ